MGTKLVRYRRLIDITSFETSRPDIVMYDMLTAPIRLIHLVKAIPIHILKMFDITGPTRGGGGGPSGDPVGLVSVPRLQHFANIAIYRLSALSSYASAPTFWVAP